ncbi:glmZ(sRNA)-inactivating NTPase [Nitrincola sp. A-D6]|uniref:RNase adapter RapZ n=1 Tax=Nitrincola sp. A-D6 TaxID=1545442 RepID=UPI00051FCEF3|nr:RNase adapter RapZ [Nitrincola sp. A-D6]KGK43094.1 glmZ(sRNA)-inactivating NTPase [Nitrincola sp. A-D6]
MKLVILSGRSGSGKTTALQALEDAGFYCIDNLPAILLPELIKQMTEASGNPSKIAVSIDARNLTSNLERFPALLEQLKQFSNLSCEVIYLDASESTLLKRFSATRRKHPLTDIHSGLREAINYERALLEPIATLADMRIDTTRLTLYELRDRIKLRITQRREQSLSLLFESFGFKHGVPLDADFTFDVRTLPNPHWVPELRPLTGLDTQVRDFLQQSSDVDEMKADIIHFLERWLPRFRQDNRSYLTVCIGCTGGQHRSVYLAEHLASHFSVSMDNVHVRHRELT